jgi:phage terminase small subunit
MAEETPPLDPESQLTEKQRAFLDAYITNGYNATEAAKASGYKQPHSQGPRLLDNVGIRAALDSVLKSRHLSRDEVLARVEEQATGTLEDFLSVNKKKELVIDIKKAKERGKLHLIQDIKQQRFYDKAKKSEVHEITIKLHSAQRSLSELLRVHRMVGDSDQDKTKAKLLETQLEILRFELQELQKKYERDPNARNIEGRPRPQGGPGTGPCGLYHAALDPNIYPEGKLSQEGAVDPLQPCPVCGGDPFVRSEP